MHTRPSLFYSYSTASSSSSSSSSSSLLNRNWSFLSSMFWFLFLWHMGRPPLGDAACISCNVSACDPWFLYYTYEGDAACVSGGPSDLNQIVGLKSAESGTANCSGNVIPWMCAGFRKNSEIQENASCPNPSPSDAITCSTWCDKIAACLTSSFFVQSLACTDPNKWAQPGQPCNNVSEADVQKPTAPWQPIRFPQCPLATDTADPNVQLQFALGAMYPLTLQADCPPIPLVPLNIKFSDLAPAKCLEHFIQRPAYANFFYFFMPFVVVTFSLYQWRRNTWPINARNGPLIYAFIFFLLVGYLLFMEYEIFGTSSRCELLAVASTMAGPLFFMPLALRAFRLLYLYRWNQSKRKNKKRDWYFDHRWMIAPRTTVIVMVFNTMCCLAAALSILFTHQSGLFGPLLSTGRCLWFHYTPEVIAYANQTLGAVGPSILNPWGYGPYSPDLLTCTFCNLSDVIEAILGWNFLFIVIVMIFIVLLRNINDQYWIWRELMLVSVANVFLFPFTVVAVYPPAREAMNMERTDFIGKTILCVTAWDYCCTIILPLVLSFTRQAKSGNSGVRKNRIESVVGSTSVSGFITVDPKAPRGTRNFLMEVDAQGKVNVSVDLDDVIDDPVGLECLRNFAVELFKAELVEFYVRIKGYQRIKSEEKMQIEASKIYHTYIKDGAILQINISYKQRIKYDKLNQEGHFVDYSMEQSVTTSQVRAGGGGDFGALGLGFTQSSDAEKPKDVPRESGDGSPPRAGRMIARSMSPSISPSTQVRNLSHHASEENLNPGQFERLQSGTQFDRLQSLQSSQLDRPSLTVDTPVAPPSAEKKESPTETDSREYFPISATVAEDKPFRAIDFTEPLKEVRQLIYDDWIRFQQSKHWEVFLADLQKRTDLTPKEEEQGLTEFHPVVLPEDTPQKPRPERLNTYSRSSVGTGVSSSGVGEPSRLEPVEDSSSGLRSSVDGRGSSSLRLVTSRSVLSVVSPPSSPHPDAA